jgi:hypothetical protein
MTKITKTIFLENTNGTPEDRYIGKPSFVGQKFALCNFPMVVVKIIEVNPENQLVILDHIDLNGDDG